MRANLDGLRSRDIRHGPGFIFQNEVMAMATGAAIAPGSPPMIFLNPGGAVSYKMPTSGATPTYGANGIQTNCIAGQVFIFVNLSGNVVTLQTDGGAAFTTAVSVAANGATRVVCTGSTTQALGWVIW